MRRSSLIASLVISAVLLLAPPQMAAEEPGTSRPAWAKSSAAPATKPAPPAHLAAKPPAPEAPTAPAPVAPPPVLPSPAPGPGSTPITGGGLKLLLGSLGLAALLLIASRVVKRLPIARFLPSAEGPIRVKARTHLGAKEKLCLVEVGRTSLLLAITAQGVKTLHVWPAGVDTAPASPAGAWDSSAADTGGIPGQLRSLEARIAATRR